MVQECLICERIEDIKNGNHPYFVTELETGYVVLGDYQFFRGYTLLLCKQHASELHQLDRDYRTRFLQDMSLVAEAVWQWVNPKVLNYEALGNLVDHLHWHIFPRHADDPLPAKPIWQIPKEKREAEKYKLSEEQLLQQCAELRKIIDSCTD